LLGNNVEMLGMPGALGILLGVEPGAAGVGKGLVGAEGALTTIEAIGIAVGFSDSNEKEGEKVGVGKREDVPETGVTVEGEPEEGVLLEVEVEVGEEAGEA